ncbi:CG0192-related protein [Rhodococcus jostii]|uniref:Maltokinase N-terminal cap domain-containing protein n=1 Tax=Rhodococcus jostii TaxID=132919 RepID=A0A1H5DML1_RHOJO|nr:hypothetical protein [Rhodococcus jostii]SED80076.1 hypothetical protein SAMN04490220_5595 [Rhodococcus jostii]
MALIYQAQLTPTKAAMLRDWIPRQPWIGSADASSLEVAGAYRFDDPDGEVGIETHLVRTADGQVVQVPVTYRGAPLAGAESALITTMHHSVLGERWVYDACADPVYVRALVTAIVAGGTEAKLEFASPGERPEVTTRVSGSGSPRSAVPVVDAVTCASAGANTVITSGDIDVELVRVLDSDRVPDDQALALGGIWPGQDVPALLAIAHSTAVGHNG